MDVLQNTLIQFLPKVMPAIVILIAGYIISKVLRSIFKKIGRRRLSATLHSFLSKLISAVVWVLTIIIALSVLGVPTTSLIAVLGASSLAIGLALRGFLANIAAGFVIIFLRPFHIGDFIMIADQSGTVEEINLFMIQLKTVTNDAVFIPNNQVVDGVVMNRTFHNTRRIDLTIGISYSTDVAQAKSVIESYVDSHEKVLKDPLCVIAVDALADNSVNLTIRAWVNTPDYTPVRFELIEGIKQALDANGISIPFPQLDVHWIKN